MTDTELLTLVKESHLLTEQEKVYWNANMSHMNAQQKARLESILVRAQKISWNKHIQKYLSLIGTTLSNKHKAA